MPEKVSVNSDVQKHFEVWENGYDVASQNFIEKLHLELECGCSQPLLHLLKRLKEVEK